MNNMKQTFEYGRFSYDYHLEFSDRKTLGIVVRPDLQIIIKAPCDAKIDEIETFMKRKWKWLDKQIRELGKFHKKYYERKYVSGESFKYLGRQYLLLVEKADFDRVKLDHGRLNIYTSKSVNNYTYNKKLLEYWYESRRSIIFKRQYFAALKLFEFDKIPQFHTRTMEKRWGSYSNNKKIILNPKLIEAPTEAIYYVCVHELCHTIVSRHDGLFYQELEKRMPNWRTIKENLEVHYG